MTEDNGNAPGVVTDSSSKDRSALDPERCQFFLQKKRRYCRTVPPEGKNYCVEHSHLMGVCSFNAFTCFFPRIYSMYSTRDYIDPEAEPFDGFGWLNILVADYN